MIMRTHVFEDNYFIKRYSRVPNASVKHTINVHIGSAERAKKKLSQYGGPIFLLSKSPTVTSSSPTIYLAESAQKLNRTN